MYECICIIYFQGRPINSASSKHFFHIADPWTGPLFLSLFFRCFMLQTQSTVFQTSLFKGIAPVSQVLWQQSGATCVTHKNTNEIMMNKNDNFHLCLNKPFSSFPRLSSWLKHDTYFCWGKASMKKAHWAGKISHWWVIWGKKERKAR